jgi:hypothetical protein
MVVVHEGGIRAKMATLAGVRAVQRSEAQVSSGRLSPLYRSGRISGSEQVNGLAQNILYSNRCVACPGRFVPMQQFFLCELRKTFVDALP